jgi:hypothetical protein
MPEFDGIRAFGKEELRSCAYMYRILFSSDNCLIFLAEICSMKEDEQQF